MDKPQRPETHITDTKAKKYLEYQIPDEWHYNVPQHDYGIDYQVEISLGHQVTGLNFSIQLKGQSEGTAGNLAKTVIKHTTLSYYQVRLEPVMVVIYEDNCKKAYWAWIDDLNIDLSKGQETYTLSIPKTNLLSSINWDEIRIHVQTIFNNRSFIGDFDLSKIHDNVELAAWKVYNDGDYEQAVYLFRRLIIDSKDNLNIRQALAWSLYRCYRYADALVIINQLLNLRTSLNYLQIKACILAEFGFSDRDKGKIIQARDLFRQSLEKSPSAIMHYNYANTLSELSDYEAAVTEYLKSIESDPNVAECWKNLGTAQGHLEKFSEELRCYDVALSINPDLPQALFSKGITLAQRFQRYDDALVLFNRVLSQGDDLIKGYILGLTWVAEAYQQTGDLTSALYWIDYGLNFRGTDLSFLNFKSNLLAKNWRYHPEFKQIAEDFFNYRLELENDLRSLYHLIELLGLDLGEALPLLQKHTPLFQRITNEQLVSIDFDLETASSTLLQMNFYGAFRSTYFTTRYVDHLITPYFSIPGTFWDLMDLVCAAAFTGAIKEYSETGKAELLAGKIFDGLSDGFPKLIPYLVPFDQRWSFDDKTAVFATVYSGMETIVYRETGAQSGHIAFGLKLRQVDPEEYITAKRKEQLSYNLYHALIAHLRLAESQK
ncbi:DUF4365 domain-containing protein [Mucilaginibacter sp. dw_454]|uniref:DUF4365 domain-containing protein n=1 Tax=Mucilaginibacter sp. dw_454 TaxID=2720079 RepID=UPI001BD30894|nr:DUF4365 domain-containing protein [Mucilaginibacter sp. dw_454]